MLFVKWTLQRSIVCRDCQWSWREFIKVFSCCCSAGSALEFRSLRLPHNAVYNVARHGRFACSRGQSRRSHKTHLRDARSDLKLDRLRAQTTRYRADVSVSCQLSVADDGRRVLCTCCISRSSEHGSAQTASGERAPESTCAVLLAAVEGRSRSQLQQPQRCVQK